MKELEITRILSSLQVVQSNLKLVEMAASECAEQVVAVFEDSGMPKGRFEIMVRFIPSGMDSGL